MFFFFLRKFLPYKIKKIFAFSKQGPCSRVGWVDYIPPWILKIISQMQLKANLGSIWCVFFGQSPPSRDFWYLRGPCHKIISFNLDFKLWWNKYFRNSLISTCVVHKPSTSFDHLWVKDNFPWHQIHKANHRKPPVLPITRAN